MPRHWAELNGAEVVRVVVCDDPEWLESGFSVTWVETHKHDPDEVYCGPGFIYDAEEWPHFFPPLPDATFQQVAPDAILSASGLSGSVGALQAEDGSWLTAPGSNTETEVRVSFPTPDSAPLGQQSFRVQVRKTSHSSNPSAVVELWEAGAMVATVVAAVTVSSTTGQILAGTWDATGRDPAAIECVVAGSTGSGNPNQRASVEVGAIAWDAQVAA